jgi:translation elongation factor EF-G
VHKKQTGGSGQYGKVVGYIEPLEEGDSRVVFENGIVGNAIEPRWGRRRRRRSCRPATSLSTSLSLSFTLTTLSIICA